MELLLLNGREGRRLFVLGRIEGPPRVSNSLRGYLATAGYGGRVFDQTASDGTGRFLLEFDDRDIVRNKIEFIDVYVTTAAGARSGARRIEVKELSSPQIVLFRVTHIHVPPTPPEPAGVIRRFTANGEAALLVDTSCSEVLLEWDVEGDDAIELLLLGAGGQLIDNDVPRHGGRQIRARKSTRYTLAARERTRAEREMMMPTTTLIDQRTVNVRRFPTLSLFFEEHAPRGRRPMEVGIATSCPAPEEGLLVTLLSSDPARLEGGEIVIPGGEMWATTSLYVGAQAGEVELTGLAPGYLRDSVRATVLTTTT